MQTDDLTPDNSSNQIDKLLKKLWHFVKIALKLVVFFFLIADPTLHTLFHLVESGKLFESTITLLVPLAATFSFSSLMYSRARSIKSKRHKLRSLYVAERSMIASGHYLACILTILLCYQLALKYNLDLSLSDPIMENPWGLVLIPTLYFFLGYCFELYLAIAALDYKINGRRTKNMARRIRKLL